MTATAKPNERMTWTCLNLKCRHKWVISIYGLHRCPNCGRAGQ